MPDAHTLRRTIREHRVDTLWLTASLFNAVVEEEPSALAGLEQLLIGGEALSVDHVRRHRRHHPATRLINGYGPTENTTFTCCHPIPSAVAQTASIPIGRPIAGTRVLVLDRQLRRAALGCRGQLCLSGSGLARGYLDRPGLCAGRFVPDPYAFDPGGRLYLSGDQVRWLGSGEVEFLGRFDHQVKVRGFRIELGEIEAALGRHPAVERCAVTVRRKGSSAHLVAYVVAAEDFTPTTKLLREDLGATLPEHMVPAVFLFPDAFPLNANGKVDRAALPDPKRRSPAGEHLAPRNPVETTLREVWAQVLGREPGQVSVDDNFFELGGDSILSIQITSRARRAGLEVTPKQVFAHQTIAALARVVTHLAPEPSERPDPVPGDVPLLPIQHWFFAREWPERHHFNQAVLLELRQPLTPPVLERALSALVTQHDALRLRFSRDATGWRQAQTAEGHVPLTTVDLSRLAVPAEELERQATVAQASLSLDAGELARAVCFELGEGGRRLMIAIHHLVVDGISWRILLEDLERAARQLLAGRETDLGSKTASYQQWARALAEAVDAGRLDDDLEHWCSLLSAASGPLPVDDLEARNTLGSARTVSIALDEDATRTLLHDVRAAYRTEVNDLLLAALVLTLGPWIESCGDAAAERRRGPATLLLDLEGHGREDTVVDVDVSRTVGWFTSMYPVRLEVEDVTDPAALLKAVKEQLRQIPHRGMSYGLLRHLSSNPEARRLSEMPAPQVAFNYLGQYDAGISASAFFGVARESAGRPHGLLGERAHLIEIDAVTLEGRLELRWSYSEACHRRSTVELLAGRYLEELRALIEHCLSPEARGLTPSDFPLAGLDQPTLDQLVEQTLPEEAICEIEALHPLSPMQEGLLFHSLYEPSSGAYFEQMVCEIRGAVDVEAFEQAWQQVVARHPVLRSAPVWEGLERPLAWVRNRIDVRLERREWPAEDTASLPESFLRTDRGRGFELDQAPLMRFTWFDVPAAEPRFVFVWSFHHLLLDGWSIANVMREVFQAYAELSAGREPEWVAVPPYEDYLAWLASRDADDAETFWRDYLAGFSAPTPLPGAGSPTKRGSEEEDTYAEVRLSVGDEMSEALNAWLRRRHLTQNTLVQALWALLLGRYSGERDVVFGVTMAGRPAQLPRVEEMVGLFINTLPLRGRPEGRAVLTDWLRELQEQQAEMRHFESTPLPEVRSWSDVPSGMPLFESLLVFENYPVDTALREENLPLAIRGARVIEQTHYPLTLIAIPASAEGGALRFALSYDRTRIDHLAARRLGRQLVTLLGEVATDPARRLEELVILDCVQRHQVLREWNATTDDVGASGTATAQLLHRLFESQAARTPEAVALLAAHTGHHVTYGDLDSRACRVARALGALPTEGRVGVCVERCPAMVVGMLAVLKAGGAYVPLDPAYPSERVAFMSRDAGLAALLVQEGAGDAVPDLEVRTLRLDADARILAMDAPSHGTSTVAAVRGENLAYVIYTSGSTGRPKGVAISHRSAVGLVSWARRSYSPEQLSGVLVATSMCFDLSVFELFVPLSWGGKVILADHALALAELPDCGVTLVNTVPSAMTELLRLEAVPSTVRIANLAGEALPLSLARQLGESPGIERLFNLYGPSEDTTYSTGTAVGIRNEGPPSIGRPLDGKQAYLLDAGHRPLPLGVAGSLFIAGAGLARGYLGRPRQSAERFLPDPFGEAPGGRLYATGDLGRYRGDGEIDFLGRRDHQVKLRGFRIEMGEVEATLERHPGVEESVVVVREEVPGQAYLAAYVVAGEADAAAVAEWRSWLRDRLPAYMVPSAFTPLDEMPRTPNGKADRRALAARQPERPEPSATYVAPRNPVEQELAGIWSLVLGREKVGVHDDFFALGGHSLLATQMSWRCQQAFGVTLPLRTLFEAPTVAQLAETVKTLQWVLESQEPSEIDGELQEVGEL